MLTFTALRKANLLRLPRFKSRAGHLAHSKADGSDWSPNDWCVAVLGELGEAANLLKKVRRGDMSMAEARPELQKEFADIQVYLDIAAYQCGIDLGEATRLKYNEVSRRVDAPDLQFGACAHHELQPCPWEGKLCSITGDATK